MYKNKHINTRKYFLADEVISFLSQKEIKEENASQKKNNEFIEVRNLQYSGLTRRIRKSK
jgi:hypothetical protein